MQVARDSSAPECCNLRFQEAADGLSKALGPRWDKKALEVRQ